MLIQTVKILIQRKPTGRVRKIMMKVIRGINQFDLNGVMSAPLIHLKQ